MTVTVNCIDKFERNPPDPPSKNVFHRFYIEKITFLKENTTVELFFLNAKALVFNVSIFYFVLFILRRLFSACPSVLDYVKLLFLNYVLKSPHCHPLVRHVFWHYSNRSLNGALEFLTKVNKTLTSRIAYV